MNGHVRERFDRNTGKRRTGWQARYTDPANPTKRIEKTFKLKKEAEAWLAIQQASILQGDHVDHRRADRPFREVVAAWKGGGGGLEAPPPPTYQNVLGRFLLPEFGGRKIGSITHEVVQRYVNRLST